MNPTEIRNLNWEQLQAKLVGLRLDAFGGWRWYGPGTTREVSARCGMDILTFRPRTTELLKMGLLECIGGKSEGIYRARTQQEWERWNEAQKRGQLELI